MREWVGRPGAGRAHARGRHLGRCTHGRGRGGAASRLPCSARGRREGRKERGREKKKRKRKKEKEKGREKEEERERKERSLGGFRSGDRGRDGTAVGYRDQVFGGSEDRAGNDFEWTELND